MQKNEKHAMIVTFENLTEAQKIGLCDLFAVWQQAGSLGCSRWTGFFADGDGNFRPRITVDGQPPAHQDLVEPGKFWTNGEPWRGEYKMDFDAIAWKLRDSR